MTCSRCGKKCDGVMSSPGAISAICSTCYLDDPNVDVHHRVKDVSEEKVAVATKGRKKAQRAK